MSELSIRRAIADAIYAQTEWGEHVNAEHIRKVTFRHHLQEIDVTYFEPLYDDAEQDPDEISGAATIPTFEVLTILLQQAVDKDGTQG